MLEDHPPILIFAIPFFLLTLWGEAYFLQKRGREKGLVGYARRDTTASLAMGIGSLIVGIIIILGDVPISIWAWNHRLFNLGEGVLGWIVALVAWDFSYYWAHRAGHRIRLLWANHVQHHSSQHYNLSTALRQPVTSFNEWLFFPTLALLGIPPWMIFASGSLNLIYQYWIHTEAITTLPRWFEFVFNTPSHHRVHHGSNQRYLDRNYGGIFIIWDRLFRTFEPEAEEVIYGLTKNIHSFNPWIIATHEYQALGHDMRTAPRFVDKVRFAVKPPGWQPTVATLVATAERG